MMKIRTDFVTNSSSSSFISISIKNKEIMKKLKGYEDFQSISGFVNEDDWEFLEFQERRKELNELFLAYYKDISGQACNIDDQSFDDEFLIEELSNDFNNATKPVINAYLTLLEKEGGVKAKMQDLIIEKYEMFRDEFFYNSKEIERNYGIICNGITNHLKIYYDNSGEKVDDKVIEFNFIRGITEELLNKIIDGHFSVKAYFSELKTTDFCLSEIVAAFQKGLKEKGKSDEEVKALIGEYLE